MLLDFVLFLHHSWCYSRRSVSSLELQCKQCVNPSNLGKYTLRFVKKNIINILSIIPTLHHVMQIGFIWEQNFKNYVCVYVPVHSSDRKRGGPWVASSLTSSALKKAITGGFVPKWVCAYWVHSHIDSTRYQVHPRLPGSGRNETKSLKTCLFLIL